MTPASQSKVSTPSSSSPLLRCVPDADAVGYHRVKPDHKIMQSGLGRHRYASHATSAGFTDLVSTDSRKLLEGRVCVPARSCVCLASTFPVVLSLIFVPLSLLDVTRGFVVSLREISGAFLIEYPPVILRCPDLFRTISDAFPVMQSVSQCIFYIF